MSLETITDAIKAKVGTDSGINATVKFVLDDTNYIYVDGSQVPNVVSNDNKDAQCTVKTSMDTVSKILSGDMNAMSAFMMGKIKVEGNMAIAMNINKIL